MAVDVYNPWGTGYLPPNYGVTTGASLTVTYSLPVSREFHTWREAVLQALDAADLFNTATKPAVRWVADRWVVSYQSRPVLMNGDAA